MLDEAGTLFEEISRKSHPNIYRVTNSGRHKGYTVWVSTQRPTSIPPTIRDNCDEGYCFLLGAKRSAQLVWEDFNEMCIAGIQAWKVIQSQSPLKCVHMVKPNIIERLSLN